MRLHASGYGALSAAIGARLPLGTLIVVATRTAARPFLAYTLTLLPSVPLVAAIPYS